MTGRLCRATAGQLHRWHGREAPDLCGVDRMTEAPKPPRVLDAIADKVLAYKPKPKSEAAKKRKKTKRKLEKAND